VKSISVAQQQALDATFGLPVLFAEVDWAEGLERYVTAGADIVWNGQTWKGISDVVGIGSIEESDAVEATAVRFTLNGVPSSRISQALQTSSQGRRATLWMGVLDPNANPIALIGTPTREFEGRLDAPAIGETATDQGVVTTVVSVTAESRMAALLSANVRRYTDQDQRKFHPGDDFFKFAAEMAERLIVFPSAQAQRR
jgi:hypothetical protein